GRRVICYTPVTTGVRLRSRTKRSPCRAEPREPIMVDTQTHSLSVVPRTSADGPHPFARCVNPHLAALLNKVWLDKRFVRGEGSELIDENGRRYLDAVAAYGALPFGFNPPAIWRSLRDVRLAGEPSF